MSLVYVPKFWNSEDLLYLENELKDLAMNVESLNNFEEEEFNLNDQNDEGVNASSTLNGRSKREEIIRNHFSN